MNPELPLSEHSIRHTEPQTDIFRPGQYNHDSSQSDSGSDSGSDLDLRYAQNVLTYPDNASLASQPIDVVVDRPVITREDVLLLLTKNPYHNPEYKEKLQEVYKKISAFGAEIEENSPDTHPQKEEFDRHFKDIIRDNPNFSLLLINNLELNCINMDMDYRNDFRQNKLNQSKNLILSMASLFMLTLVNIGFASKNGETRGLEIANGVLGTSSALSLAGTVYECLKKPDDTKHKNFKKFFGDKFTEIFNDRNGFFATHSRFNFVSSFLADYNNSVIEQNPDGQGSREGQPQENILFRCEIDKTSTEVKFKFISASIDEYRQLSQEEKDKFTHERIKVKRSEISNLENFKRFANDHELIFYKFNIDENGQRKIGNRISAEEVFNDAKQNSLDEDFFNQILKYLPDKVTEKFSFMSENDIRGKPWFPEIKMSEVLNSIVKLKHFDINFLLGEPPATSTRGHVTMPIRLGTTHASASLGFSV